MRKFTAECKDTVTGYSMILSECSYNMAMDWLMRELKSEDVVVASNLDGFFDLITIQVKGVDRKFFYDEARGYLLGE